MNVNVKTLSISVFVETDLLHVSSNQESKRQILNSIPIKVDKHTTCKYYFR